MKQSARGFTIVELLIVIVVIGILAAISVVAYSNISANARDSERKSDIATMQKVLELYYADNGRFPARAQMIDPVWRAANLATSDQGIFINPQDTSSTSSIVMDGTAVALHKYSYYEIPVGVGTGYVIDYKLEKSPTTNIHIVR